MKLKDAFVGMLVRKNIGWRLDEDWIVSAIGERYLYLKHPRKEYAKNSKGTIIHPGLVEPSPLAEPSPIRSKGDLG